PRKIAIMRNTSVRAVYKIIKRLKEKGVFSNETKRVHRVHNLGPTCEPYKLKNKGPYWRIHGQEWHIRVLYDSEFYKSVVHSSPSIQINGHRILVYKNVIKIYGKMDFIGDKLEVALRRSVEYWDRFFTRLENHFKVVLVKPRAHNIRQVNCHIAEVNNGIAKEARIKKEKIKFYCREDGKLWFQCDHSFKLDEAEFLHPKTNYPDASSFEKYFNDLRVNGPMLISEIQKFMQLQIKQSTKHGQQINSNAQHIGLNAQTMQTILNIIEAQLKDNTEKIKATEEKLKELEKYKNLLEQ
ncbi:MAG: hypothetical protein GTO02_23190, partial [Candidatus Dadabacteria bacterium]|nr:hypothetical protein [Candidatus Dadabacteria bacterium]